jgi:hypothetical protein
MTMTPTRHQARSDHLKVLHICFAVEAVEAVSVTYLFRCRGSRGSAEWQCYIFVTQQRPCRVAVLHICHLVEASLEVDSRLLTINRLLRFFFES